MATYSSRNGRGDGSSGPVRKLNENVTELIAAVRDLIDATDCARASNDALASAIDLLSGRIVEGHGESEKKSGKKS